MGRLEGRNIILYDKTQTGVDGFNRPIYTESPTVVENVLIGLPTPQEVIDTLNLHRNSHCMFFKWLRNENKSKMHSMRC